MALLSQHCFNHEKLDIFGWDRGFRFQVFLVVSFVIVELHLVLLLVKYGFAVYVLWRIKLEKACKQLKRNAIIESFLGQVIIIFFSIQVRSQNIYTKRLGNIRIIWESRTYWNRCIHLLFCCLGDCCDILYICISGRLFYYFTYLWIDWNQTNANYVIKCNTSTF